MSTAGYIARDAVPVGVDKFAMAGTDVESAAEPSDPRQRDCGDVVRRAEAHAGATHEAGGSLRCWIGQADFGSGTITPMGGESRETGLDGRGLRAGLARTVEDVSFDVVAGGLPCGGVDRELGVDNRPSVGNQQRADNKDKDTERQDLDPSNETAVVAAQAWPSGPRP